MFQQFPDHFCHSLCPSPLSTNQLKDFKAQWLTITDDQTYQQEAAHLSDDDREYRLVNWLIEVFNATFSVQNTCLERGTYEPEYFPATSTESARIVFAHGYFASALHEISHWCIAGKTRRKLPDFGYWYAPDGRNEAQQQAFEQVEIKPQAIECLFTVACNRRFQVSQDNLDADFDTQQSTFAKDVEKQVLAYLANPTNLPQDAQVLLHTLLLMCKDSSHQ